MKILPVSMERAKELASSFFIELYVLHLKTGIIRICNCDEIITFAGNEYYPVPIQRGTIKSTVDAKIDNVELKIADTDNSKVSALLQGFDFRGRYVEILRIQYPESLEDDNAVMTMFYGYLDTPSYSNGEFTVTVKASFPNNKIPCRITQYFCNAQFGDEQCKMDKVKRSVSVNTNDYLPNKIKLNEEGIEAGFYKNGLITIGYETKLIKDNTVEDGVCYVLTQYPFLGDILETAILQRNCDKTPEMCDKYDNRKNYSGFLAVPKEFRLG